MILYNITLKVDHSIHDQWYKWMKEKHVVDVLATGCFINCRMSHLLGQNEDDGITYSMQYLAPSMKKFHEYQAKYATQLKQESFEYFGDKVLPYRTMMEVVEEFTHK